MGSDAKLQSLLLEPYGWAGIDGNWSTFRVDVGTPPQGYEVLPSTCASEIWVAQLQGCGPELDVPHCPASRGILSPVNGSSSNFSITTSKTWQLIGIERLGSEDHYFEGNEKALYGLDTLSLYNDMSTTISNQIIAGIATSNFWLGIFGLGNIPAQFSTLNKDVSSPISSLKADNSTTSLSYGYSAGASYRKSLIH